MDFSYSETAFLIMCIVLHGSIAVVVELLTLESPKICKGNKTFKSHLIEQVK